MCDINPISSSYWLIKAYSFNGYWWSDDYFNDNLNDLFWIYLGVAWVIQTIDKIISVVISFIFLEFLWVWLGLFKWVAIVLNVLIIILHLVCVWQCLNVYCKKSWLIIVMSLLWVTRICYPWNAGSIYIYVTKIGHHYTPAQRSWRGGILDSPCPSVCPSVRLSVRLSVDDIVSGA